MSTESESESDPSSFFDVGEPIGRSIEDEVRSAIIEVAPDLEADDLESSIDLHDDIGLDSIDLLNISSAIAERIGFTVPESEISRLHTVGDLVTFIEQSAATDD